MLDQLKLLLLELNSEYLIKHLKEDKSKQFLNLELETCFEKDLGFDFECYDYFVGELNERYLLDVSSFYTNTHTEGMSYEIFRLFTKILLPIVGLQKWMVFNEFERVPLCVKDILDAMKSRRLCSKLIYERIQRNEVQNKVYSYL